MWIDVFRFRDNQSATHSRSFQNKLSQVESSRFVSSRILAGKYHKLQEMRWKFTLVRYKPSQRSMLGMLQERTCTQIWQCCWLRKDNRTGSRVMFLKSHYCELQYFSIRNHDWIADVKTKRHITVHFLRNIIKWQMDVESWFCCNYISLFQIFQLCQSSQHFAPPKIMIQSPFSGDIRSFSGEYYIGR